jgi:hypothetical protein
VKSAEIWPVSCDEVRARPARRRWNQESLAAGTMTAGSETAGPVAKPLGRVGSDGGSVVSPLCGPDVSSVRSEGTNDSPALPGVALSSPATPTSLWESPVPERSKEREVSSSSVASSATSTDWLKSGCVAAPPTAGGVTGMPARASAVSIVSAAASASSSDSGTSPISPVTTSAGRTSETSFRLDGVRCLLFRRLVGAEGEDLFDETERHEDSVNSGRVGGRQLHVEMLAVVAGDLDRHQRAGAKARRRDKREVFRMRQPVVFHQQPLPRSDHAVEMGLMQPMSSGAQPGRPFLDECPVELRHAGGRRARRGL